jgi:hypothetical protein
MVGVTEWACPVHGVDAEHILAPHVHGAKIASGSLTEFVRDVRQRRLPVSDMLAPFRCPADAAYASLSLGETRVEKGVEKEVVVGLRPPLMPLQVPHSQKLTSSKTYYPN